MGRCPFCGAGSDQACWSNCDGGYDGPPEDGEHIGDLDLGSVTLPLIEQPDGSVRVGW